MSTDSNVTPECQLTMVILMGPEAPQQPLVADDVLNHSRLLEANGSAEKRPQSHIEL